MAEIRIEKKKPVWPWILLVVIILGVVFYLWYVGNEQDATDDMDDATEEVEDDTYSVNLDFDHTYNVDQTEMAFINQKSV